MAVALLLTYCGHAEVRDFGNTASYNTSHPHTDTQELTQGAFWNSRKFESEPKVWVITELKSFFSSRIDYAKLPSTADSSGPRETHYERCESLTLTFSDNQIGVLG